MRYLLIACMIFLCSSCKKEDDNSPRGILKKHSWYRAEIQTIWFNTITAQNEDTSIIVSAECEKNTLIRFIDDKVCSKKFPCSVPPFEKKGEWIFTSDSMLGASIMTLPPRYMAPSEGIDLSKLIVIDDSHFVIKRDVESHTSLTGGFPLLYIVHITETYKSK
jgi:hypothetical protein